jgi:Colicin immunity protein / pyocin immunity protein
MHKAVLLELVERICDENDELDEDEVDVLSAKFADSIAHPAGTDLIFYPKNWGLRDDPTPAEIVNAATSWQPRIICVRVVQKTRHPREAELFCYEIEVPQFLRTQVVSSESLEKGDKCIVALSGVKLPDGKLVQHGLIDKVFTVGKLISKTDLDVGSVIT